MPRRNLTLIVLSAVLALICYQTAERSPYGRYFEEVLEQIDSRYVKDVDRQVLFDAAVAGMMQTLDENSAFIARTEAPEFEQALEGEFGGIGIEVTKETDMDPILVIPMIGSPARAAGMRTGDQILEINGKSTLGVSLSEAVTWMRGRIGEPVLLKVQHAGEESPVQIEVVRAVIHVDSVVGDRRDADGNRVFQLEEHPEIGYIRITSFGTKTTGEMEKALAQVKASGAKALVLDLRGNPGGLLTTAVEIADMFLDDGLIVSIRGRGEETYSATHGGTSFSLPVVVLINGASASASEIVAASLQDHNRATIVGERSYGKGTVQNMIRVEGGRSMLKLTTADYWRPSNRKIHRHREDTETDEWGVHPNEGFDVPMTAAEIIAVSRLRQQRDLNQDAKASASGTPASETSDATTTPADDRKSVLELDPQLRRGVEVLLEKLGPATPKIAA